MAKARRKAKKLPECKHVPDPTTVRPADGMDWVFDVWCKKCGRSGAFTTGPSDVDWGDEDGPPQVWVLEYDHKHGTDVSVYTTEAAALRSVVDIMDEYMQDLKEVDAAAETQVRAHIQKGEARKAMIVWERHMRESFVIQQASVRS